jgi:hypothetical protein
MTSPFATRLAAIGAPLGIRHNGESITLSNADDQTAIVKAIAEIDDVTDSSEGFIVVTGRLLIETAVVSRKLTPLGTILKAVVRGEEWHVYEQSGDREGFVRINIRRKIDEAQHTNIYDINGEQAVWHEV